MFRYLKRSLRNTADTLARLRSARTSSSRAQSARLRFEPLEARQMLNIGPLISEFMAKNDTVRQDDYGVYSDWIELHNPTVDPVDLDGWHLTDDATDLDKWTFPAVTLQPNDYLLVFASNRDTTGPGGYLHTNFRLSMNGEYLALVQADGATVAHDFAPEYPRQSSDISYGLWGEREAYFRQPTPGAANQMIPLVHISEFMARNEITLQDGDSNYSDWIEIHNPTTAQVVLDGWHLTDDYDALTRWEFPDTNPDTVIPAGGYLVVFASDGREEVLPPPLDPNIDAAGNLHTNFKLSGNGEFLALVDDGSSVMHAYTPKFPPQFEDVSYGEEGYDHQYYAHPTPGGPNLVQFTADPVFSVERGFYDDSFNLEITTATPGAEIYYTTDGSEPSETNGTLFDPEQPIDIDTTTTLRAAATKADRLNNVATHTYIFLDDPDGAGPLYGVLTQPEDPAGFPASWPGPGGTITGDYEMDPRVVTDPRYSGTIRDDLKAIPTISLVMDHDDLFGLDNGIYTHPLEDWEKPVSVEMFDGQNQTFFQADSGVEIHGGLGRYQNFSLKQSFRLKFKPGYGASELNYPLFGDEADRSLETVVLRAGSSDSWALRGNPPAYRETYLNDRWVAESQEAMGGLAPHGTWVHLYINGLYWGLYNPVERPREDFTASYFGGAKQDYDIYSHGGLRAGDLAAWNGPEGLFTLLDQVTANPAHQDAYEAVAAILDIPGFIDYMLVNIFAGNTDWPGNNWYASRKREDGAQWRFHSWDAEKGLSKDDTNWTMVGGEQNSGDIYFTLRQVEEFQVLFADHIHRHMRNNGVLSVGANGQRITSLFGEIYEAMVGESARWGDGSKALAPHLPDPPALWTRDDKWDAELWSGEAEPGKNALVGGQDSYFEVRGAYDPAQSAETSVIWQYRNIGLYPEVDDETPIEPPVFSQHGGAVSSGYQLTITAPAWTIYYTTDETDPREYWTGNNVGTAYTVPITLNQSTVVKARAWDATNEVWSALTEVAFAVDGTAVAHDLLVTEINYHPYDATPEELATQSPIATDFDSSDFEFIELINSGAGTIDLTRMSFTEGIFYNFALSDVSELGPGERLVLVSNTEAFALRYGPDVPIAGVFQGDLDDDGEQITLGDRDGQTVFSFAYNDFDDSDGNGLALELVAPTYVPSAEPDRASFLDLADSWRTSEEYGGTPGNRQVLVWDGLGGGNWNDIDGPTGNSRWRWADAPNDPTTLIPNQFQFAVVPNNVVTVDTDVSVRGVKAEGGGVYVVSGATLFVERTVTLGGTTGAELIVVDEFDMHDQIQFVPLLEVDQGTLGAGLMLALGTARLDGTLRPDRCVHDTADPPIINALDPKDGPMPYGGYTALIVAGISISGTFDTTPGPHVADDHLGHGLWLTDRFEVENGGHLATVTYEPTAVYIDVFQAMVGDTDGNRKIQGADMLNILNASKFGDAVYADWTEGDFDGDHRVTGDDILLFLGTGWFGDGEYWPLQEAAGGGQSATAQGGGSTLLAGSTVELLLTPQGLMIDTDDVPINGYLIKSQQGIFTGHQARNLGMFREDTDRQISGGFDYVLTGKHLLGKVIGDEFGAVDLSTDLTLSYTIEGQTGIYTATIGTVSAETLAWLADYDAGADESTFSHGVDPAAADLLLAMAA